MAEKSRGLSIFLFICALLSGVIFYGCGGGGGTSSESVPMQISGNVTSLIPLRSLRADSALNSDMRSASAIDLSGIEVYLENYREQNSTRSDSDGKFLLSGVPAGSHFLVARVDTATGSVLKARSVSAMTVSESRPAAQAPAMEVKEATAIATGRIVDVNNNGINGARLMLWGESFVTRSDGYYSTPLMPKNTIASVVVVVPGYQQTAIEVKFTDNPPFVEQTIVGNSATNRPPTSTLVASKYAVSPGVSIALSATASDPDQTLDSDSYSWTSTLGAFSGSLNSLTAAWIAPGENALATITFTVTDSGGLRSRSSALVVVGTGVYAPNVAPTVTSINANSSSFVSGLSYILSANATDSNGDALTLTWTASPTAAAGVLSGQSGLTIGWKAPVVAAPSDVQIIVNVNDRKGGLASYSRVFNVVKDPAQDTNQAPDEVEILTPTANQLFVPSEKITISGRAHDPEEGELTASALTWYVKAPGQVNYGAPMSGSASFSYTLPTVPGNYSVMLRASDKYQASATAVVGFRVNFAPTATISSPANNTTVQIGSVINFNGSAIDTEDGALPASALTWLFPAPIGTRVGVSGIATNTLPEGLNVIQLSAIDSKGGVSPITTVRVTVTNTGPTMTIASPASGTSVLASASILVSGSGLGLDGFPVLASTMGWELWSTSAATETIAFGKSSFIASFTNIGAHVLTLTGKDISGKASSTKSLFYVNVAPSVTIDSPTSDVRFDLGESIALQATLTDPDPSDVLTATWYSQLNGATTTIGVGNPYNVSNLASGSHLITCKVTDRFGLASSSEKMILVNSLPVGNLTFDVTNQYATAPEDVPVFLSTNSSMNITMTMATDDDEYGGAVPAANIKWFFQDGPIEVPFGTGSSVSQLFPLGLATVTVRIYDSFATDFEDQASATYKTVFHVWQSRLLDIATGSDLVYLHGKDKQLIITRSAAGAGGRLLKVFNFEDGLNPYLAFEKDYVLATTTAGVAYSLATANAAVIYDTKLLALGTFGGNHLLVSDPASPTVYNLGGINGATSVSVHPTDKTIGYITVGGNELLKFSPANKALEGSLTAADGVTFNGLSRVRCLDGNPLVGKVFAADRINDRVVRYLDYSLGNPIVTTATAPVDMAISGNYLLTLGDDSKISVYYIDGTGKSIFQMAFGGATAGSAAGLFNTPEGMFCSGNDLFILESGNNRVHLIRSGMTNWLSGPNK
ncbi:MAG: hypothetical protein KKB51_20200 [Candidatus Riflebacteria bacterium]|nr:hypothetical protein [Candidatus Riflebacteria bacterium]